MPEKKKIWTRTYSTRDQVPTCPVFTRAKIKPRFGIKVKFSRHNIDFSETPSIHTHTHTHIWITKWYRLFWNTLYTHTHTHIRITKWYRLFWNTLYTLTHTHTNTHTHVDYEMISIFLKHPLHTHTHTLITKWYRFFWNTLYTHSHTHWLRNDIDFSEIPSIHTHTHIWITKWYRLFWNTLYTHPLHTHRHTHTDYKMISIFLKHPLYTHTHTHMDYEMISIFLKHPLHTHTHWVRNDIDFSETASIHSLTHTHMDYEMISLFLKDPLYTPSTHTQTHTHKYEQSLWWSRSYLYILYWRFYRIGMNFYLINLSLSWDPCWYYHSRSDWTWD